MITVYRVFGYRFVIFVNDHSPPHVHIVGHGGEAKVTLTGDDGVSLDWSNGIGRSEIRRLIEEARRHRAYLLAEWERIHG